MKILITALLLFSTQANAVLSWRVYDPADHIPLTKAEKSEVCHITFVLLAVANDLKTKEKLFQRMPEIQDLYNFDRFYRFYINDIASGGYENFNKSNYIDNCIRHIDEQKHTIKYKDLLDYYR